jgi:hypothetical protein
MAWSVARLVVFATILGSVAAAAATACDEWSGRLNAPGLRELQTIWRELGVRSSLFADTTASSLRVTRQELPRINAHDTFLVLDVTDTVRGDWQHLIFRRTGARCRFVGAVDVAGQGGDAPARRLVPLPAGETALAVLARTRTGTGLALQRETWYLINMGGLERAPQAPRRSGRPGKPGPALGLTRDERGLERAPQKIVGPLPRVLDYPARGHMIGWPSTFDRSFSTRLQTGPGADSIDEVRVEFTVSYTSGSYIYWMPVEPLFTATRTAVYVWKREARRFVLDPARSDVDDDEIEGIFHDAEEQFLVHNVRDLAPLAGRANERQRIWLRHFLDTVADSPEKRAVMEGLR